MFLCALHLIKLRQHDSAFRATQLWFWVRLPRAYFISGQRIELLRKFFWCYLPFASNESSQECPIIALCTCSLINLVLTDIEQLMYYL